MPRARRKKRKPPPPPAPVSAAEKESAELNNAIQAGRADVVRKAAADPSFQVDFQNGRGSTALMTAVWFQKEACVKALLEAKADTNVQNLKGNTALHFAHEVAHDKIKQMLLEAGANKDLRNKSGEKPEDVEVKVQKISHNGVTVVVTKKMVTEKDKVEDVVIGDLDPMEMVTFSPSLSDACCKGDWPRAKKLIEMGVTINGQNKSGSTVLMDAVWFGHLDIVKLLIDCGAKPNIRNGRKNTALHFAYEKGEKKIIEFLEEHGATKSLNWKNNLGLTPAQLWKKKRKQPKTSKKKLSEQLKEACRKGEFVRVMDLIAKGANVNYQDYNKSTPLMNAVYGGHLDVVMLLVKRGAKPNMQNKQQKTALHFAYERKNQPIIKFLLGKGGKVVKNDHQRRGLCFTPRGSQVGAEYEVVMHVEESDEEEDPRSAAAIKKLLKKSDGYETKMRRLFERFDSDHNGCLDRQEFQSMLSKFDIKADELQDQFQLAAGGDTDAISFDEFVFWYEKVKEKRGAQKIDATSTDLLARPDPKLEAQKKEAEAAKQRAADMEAELAREKKKMQEEQAALRAQMEEARRQMQEQMAAERRKMEEEMAAMQAKAAQQAEKSASAQKAMLERQRSTDAQQREAEQKRAEEEKARLQQEAEAKIKAMEDEMRRKEEAALAKDQELAKAKAEAQAQIDAAATEQEAAKKAELEAAVEAAKKEAYEAALAAARGEAEKELARAKADHDAQAAALQAARDEEAARATKQEEEKRILQQQQAEALAAAEAARLQLEEAKQANEKDKQEAAQRAQEMAEAQQKALEEKQNEMEAAQRAAQADLEAKEAAAAESELKSALAEQKAALEYATEIARSSGDGTQLKAAMDVALTKGVDPDDPAIAAAEQVLDTLGDDTAQQDGEWFDTDSAWEQLEELGEVYYLNTITGETSWTKPEGFMDHPETAAEANGDWEVTEEYGTKFFKNVRTGQEYETAIDPETGDEYYVDTATGESTWMNPTVATDEFDLNGDELAEMVDTMVSSYDVSTNIEDNEDFDVDDLFKDLQNGFHSRLKENIGDKLDQAENLEANALNLIGDKAKYDEEADLEGLARLKSSTIQERRSDDFVRRESQVHSIDLSGLTSRDRALAAEFADPVSP